MSESHPDDMLGSLSKVPCITTLIGYEHGRWVVYLEIATHEHVRRRRIHAYSTERKAQIAADLIRQDALLNTPLLPEGLE